LPLRLDAVQIAPYEALLAFGPPLPGASLTFQLSQAENLNEAAARLFEGLHWLDAHAPAEDLTAIAAMPIPTHALGLAINDRLTRAAAPR
jgi:L-threonylcarbamoyladenylate synthase